MCMQCNFPMSFMPGMPNAPTMNPTMNPSMTPSMNCGCMSMPPMGMMMTMPGGTNFPGALLPSPEEFQLQQLRVQLQQLNFTKQNLEQSMEFVIKATTDIESAIKKIESTKSKAKS